MVTVLIWFLWKIEVIILTSLVFVVWEFYKLLNFLPLTSYVAYQAVKYKTVNIVKCVNTSFMCNIYLVVNTFFCIYYHCVGAAGSGNRWLLAWFLLHFFNLAVTQGKTSRLTDVWKKWQYCFVSSNFWSYFSDVGW